MAKRRAGRKRTVKRPARGTKKKAASRKTAARAVLSRDELGDLGVRMKALKTELEA